ncbi:MAG: outer membrane protein assembly factor BamB family protein, partial [Chloroflexota bacterium]
MNEITSDRPRRLLHWMAAVGVILVAFWLPTWDAGAATNPVADTPWPTYAQNAQRTGHSPFAGPTEMPARRWSFSRSNDHWGTDYRGTAIGLNNTVYLAAGMAGVYAIDSRTGQMKWLFSPWNTGHETWVEFPPTVASDGTLYLTSENDYIYALNPDGSILWYFLSDHLHTPVSISPDGTTVHFTSESGHIYALDRMTGDLKWSYQLAPRGVYATGRRIPVVYDTQGNLYFGWQSGVWSLTPAGQKRWSIHGLGPGPYVVGPTVASDGTMYFVSATNLMAIGMNGTLKWQFTLGNAFDRTPVLGTDGTIYLGADDGHIYAVNPNGTLKWKQQYVTKTGWACGVKSNLLLDAAGTLYFLGKDSFVYAVDSQSRAVLWRYPTGNVDNSYPGIQLSLDSDGTLYAPVDEKVAFALAPALPPAATPTATPTPTATSGSPATSTPTATPTPTSTSGGIPTGNLLANGSFEVDADGDPIPDGWSAPYHGAALVSRSDALHSEG